MSCTSTATAACSLRTTKTPMAGFRPRTMREFLPAAWKWSAAPQPACAWRTKCPSHPAHLHRSRMKQLLQHLDSGDTTVADVPVPAAGNGMMVVEARASLVSAGTERMLVEFGRSGLLDKARSQPDKVKQVLDKVRTDGLRPTIDAVRAKLDQPIPLGYCSAGVVVETGSGAGSFTRGDRVVTNGAHAEYVRVPHTLAARIPDSVSFEAAAFTPVAAIGLQGIRLAEPTLGET